MLCVVGGKMSEGINFSDKLGRAVVMIGLPFPNAHSAEWQAKLEYIENRAYERVGKAGQKDSVRDQRAQAKRIAQDFYLNACMRAVNQCVGRVIRHKEDWASIILLDRRFGTPAIEEKLPGWIRESMTAARAVDTLTFKQHMASLKRFYEDKKRKEAGMLVS